MAAKHWLGVGWALLAALAASCAQPATAIVVVVESDISVPDPLALVHADVGGAACASASCAHDFPLSGADAVALPFSFTVTPSGSGAALALRVVGRDDRGRDRVTRTVSTSFVTGRTVVLRVFLTRSCVDQDPCRSGRTCIAGDCVSDAVDPTTLATLDPGTELDGGAIDGGMRVDSGRTRDTGVDAPDAALDAPTIDANTIDAGTAPTSCASVASTTSGAFSIDPDGAGGSAPFLAYCELAADGGGWTLLATVDAGAGTLPYGDMRWTSAGPGWGTADLSVQDALFPAYYTLPVRELRVVMAPIANPLSTHAVHAAFTPSAVTTLRAAMEAAGHVTLPLAAADWNAILPSPISLGTATCESSGVPAGLPVATPTLRVRVGYVWSDQADCEGIAWVGAGAAGGSCSTGATGSVGAAGGGRMCGGGRSNERAVVWVFGR